jgi:hypothetical protein
MSTKNNCNDKKKVWKYSAPFQPYPYWVSLGHGHRYDSAVCEEFQGYQFTEAVNNMRDNAEGGSAIFNYPLESQTSDTIIFHDEAFLPHWREVALACKLFISVINIYFISSLVKVFSLFSPLSLFTHAQ